MPFFFLGFALAFGGFVIFYEISKVCDMAWEAVVECQEKGRTLEYCKERYFPEKCKQDE